VAPGDSQIHAVFSSRCCCVRLSLIRQRRQNLLHQRYRDPPLARQRRITVPLMKQVLASLPDQG